MVDQCPINFPPNKTIFWGINNEGRNIIDIKIIPEKKNKENRKIFFELLDHCYEKIGKNISNKKMIEKKMIGIEGMREKEIDKYV